MIKVLIVVSYLSGGGAEHVARKNIEALEDANSCQVAVMTCDANHPFSALPVCRLRDWRRSGLLAKAVGVFGIRENRRKAAQFLEQFRPDIIHIHDFLPFSPCLIEALAEYKRKSRCAIIMTHHTYSYICTNDSLFNYSRNTPCNACAGNFDKSIIQYNCARNRLKSAVKYLHKNAFCDKGLTDLSDFHIAPSLFMKEQLEQAGVAPVTHLPNPCIDNLRPQKTVTDREKSIVYFGRISKEKNITGFARIFLQTATDYTLHIVGTGSDEQALWRMVRADNSTRVQFDNIFLPTDQLYERIVGSRFFVLPSIWYENSPVSIVEAVNLGIIPLVSNHGGMKELVDQFGVGCLFSPFDAEEIKQLLLRLDDLWAQHTEEVSVDKLAPYTENTYKWRIVAIYENLAKGS